MQSWENILKYKSQSFLQKYLVSPYIAHPAELRGCQATRASLRGVPDILGMFFLFAASYLTVYSIVRIRLCPWLLSYNQPFWREKPVRFIFAFPQTTSTTYQIGRKTSYMLRLKNTQSSPYHIEHTQTRVSFFFLNCASVFGCSHQGWQMATRVIFSQGSFHSYILS